MRLFALETDVEKVKAQFVSPDEPEVFTLRTHGVRVVIHVLPIIGLYIAVLLLIGFLAMNGLLPPGMILWPVWLATVYIGLWALKRYVEWKYDFVLFTTDKLVMVNAGLFHQKVYPMHYEHAVSATSQSQILGFFNIGRVQIQMKDVPDIKDEDATASMDLKRINIDYIRDAAAVASRITDVLTDFQRRKMKLGTIMVPEARVTAVQAAAEQVRIQELAQQTVNPGAEQAPPPEKEQAYVEHEAKRDEQRRRLLLLDDAAS